MRTWIAAGFFLCTALPVEMRQAQAQTAAPAFEVAAIRPASFPTPDTIRSGQFRVGARVDGDRLDFGFVTLADLLPYAYRVKSFQIAGPVWTRESRWNIVAKLPEGASPDQAPEMMQALLAERFKLAVHHEKREQPVYELTAAKGGPKLEAAEVGGGAVDGSGPGLGFGLPGLFPGPPPGGPIGDGRGDAGANGNGRGGRGPVIAGGPGGTTRISPGANCGMHLELTRLTTPALADTLTPFMDRPVVDGTGLKGTYKVALDLPPEVMFAMMQNMARTAGFAPPGQGGGPGGPGAGADGRGGFAGGRGGGPPGCPDPGAALAGGAPDTSNAAIFQAVQQLGLKLQARKAPFDTIVIDRLEKRPTEN